jgi:methionine-rich copper-binding protein CopC
MTPRAGSRRLVALLWLAVVWLLLSCVPALAHARLVQEEPADGTALTESPDRVELRFSEPVDAAFSPLEVRDSDGNRVDKDNARVDPDDARVLVVDLKELTEGSYTVQWRVTSIDGHVVEGSYGFAVTDARGDQPPIMMPEKQEGNRPRSMLGTPDMLSMLGTPSESRRCKTARGIAPRLYWPTAF